MGRVLYGIVSLLLLCPSIHAQSAGGAIQGHVRDEHSAAIPDVVIEATSGDAPGTYRGTTDAAGNFRLRDLPPGEYRLTAKRDRFTGFERSAIVVRAGVTVTLNIDLKVGDVTETVEVRAESPLLEARSGGQSVNVSGELLRAVPLLEGREWYGAMVLTPGVVTTEFAGSKQFYVRGSDTTATTVQLDGADVTGAAKTGVTYLQVSTDAVQDVQVQTGGVRAATPLGSGGVVNVVTASGTNRVKGAVSLFVQPSSWNDSNQPGGTSTSIDQTQLDLSVGGPLLKDRLWGFASYRRADVETGVSRSETQLANLRALLGSFEPINSERDANFWFMKVTAQARRHHLAAFFQQDENPLRDILATAANPFTQSTGGMAGSVRLSSAWSNRWLTTFATSYNDKDRANPDLEVEGPSVRVFDSTIASAGRLSGNGQLATLGAPLLSLLAQPNEKLTLAFDATLYASHGQASHELQTGIYFEHRVQGSHLRYTNGGFTLEEHVLRQRGNAASGTVPFHRIIVNGPALTTVNQRTRDFAAYVQDSWRPVPRLTLSGGVRVDRVVVTDRVFGIEAQDSLEVGPRLGVNVAITRDSLNIARGYWARVHDQPGVVTSTGTPNLGQRDLYDLDLDGVFETTFVTPPTAGTIANRTIDADLHQPYVQEWGAGYSRQLPGRTTVNVDVTRRRFTDRPTLVEINGLYEGRVFTGYQDETFNEIYSATNNEWNTPVYTSLELSATRQTARIQALASYVRQWRHIDGTWQPNDPASFIQPDAFANHRGIGSSTGTASANSDANSLVGFHMTQAVTASSQWQDHVARVGLTLNAPYALVGACNYTYQSGTWSGPVVTRIAAADPAFGPSTVRLSNGRVVTNPLATVIRFAYPDRGQGQLRTPQLHTLNVRISRRFTFGRTTLDTSLDVFNVTNHGTDQGFVFGANQQYNPLFAQTTDRQSPRSAQLAFRFAF